MSSIFNDPNFLAELYKIAQVPTNTKLLQTSATQLIDALKQSLSPIHANSDPTFENLHDYSSFVEWLKSSGATYNRKPPFTVATVDGNQVTQTDKQVVSAILEDLRKKSVGKDTGYSEAIANVITDFNSREDAKTALFETNKTDKAVADKANPDAAQHAMVGVKIGPGGVEQTTEAPQAGQSGQSVPALQQAAQSGGLSILNGSTINLDEIYARTRAILPLILKTKTPEAHGGLNNVLIRMASKIGLFDNLTNRTHGLNEIGCSPHDDGVKVMNAIESTFNTGNSSNQYRFDELASVASYLAAMMVEVGAFYSGLLNVYDFNRNSDISEVIKNQMKWANLYQINFMSAHDQLTNKNSYWSKAK